MIWMIKKYIFYSQVEDKILQKFAANYFIEAINTKLILACLGNII